MGMMQILERLTLARTQAGLSQGQVARMMNLKSASAISHYESGLRELTVKDMLWMCELYGIAPVWLLTGANPNFDAVKFVEQINGYAVPEMHKIIAILETL